MTPGTFTLDTTIGEVPERPNGAVSKTVVGLAPTVGSNPTLSAERKVLWALLPGLHLLAYFMTTS